MRRMLLILTLLIASICAVTQASASLIGVAESRSSSAGGGGVYYRAAL